MLGSVPPCSPPSPLVPGFSPESRNSGCLLESLHIHTVSGCLGDPAGA
eukprot:COSAG05_NODE_517_length_9060_cov_7.019306_15_plen_48_part_00